MIIKNPRVILNRSRPGPDDVVESFHSHQKFVGKLLAGTSMTVKVEMSMDGSTDWQEVCVFTLDVLNEEVDTGLIGMPMPFVRANILSQSGPTPRGIIYMGN